MPDNIATEKRGLLARLGRLGPLPDDADVTQAQLDEFGDVIDRIHSSAPPDPEYVRPLLAAFGPGDGFGLYTHGVWALLKQDREAVRAAALDALDSAADGAGRWAMETLRRMREGGDATPPSGRELRLVERAIHGPPDLAYAALHWAYWLRGAEGRRLLAVGPRAAAAETRATAADLLNELG